MNFKLHNFVQQMQFFVFVSKAKSLHFCSVKSTFNKISEFSMRFLEYIEPRILQRLTLVLVAALWLCGLNEADAQHPRGWEIAYDADIESITSVIQTSNHGYIAIGNTNSKDVFILRTDVDGEVVWRTEIGREAFPGTAAQDIAADIVELPDGGFVCVGRTDGLSSNQDIYLFKVSEDGKLLWEQLFGGGNNDNGESIILTSDDHLVIVGKSEVNFGDNDIYVIKTDLDGNLVWEQVIQRADSDERASDVTETTDGGYLVTASTDELGTDRVYVIKLDANGFLGPEIIVPTSSSGDKPFSIIQGTDGFIYLTGRYGAQDILFLKLEQDLVTPAIDVVISKPLGIGNESQGQQIIQNSNNELVIVSRFQDNPVDSKFLILKTDLLGNILWSNSYGEPNFINLPFAIAEHVKHGYVIGGYRLPIPSFTPPSVLLIKTDQLGLTAKDLIEGYVFHDLANNCDFDATDLPVKGWTIEAESVESGAIFYGTTDDEGLYSIRVDSGDYNLRLIQPNQYWKPNCATSYDISFTAQYDTIRRNFPVRPEIQCADLEVDVATHYLVPCEESVYVVNYCNHGTIGAFDVEVELMIDEDLDVLTSSIPPTIVDGQRRVFDVEDLAPGQCGSFSMRVLADCAAKLGQSHCVSAHITPDEICLLPNPLWDGSSIELEGTCEGDSVKFRIRNAGQNKASERKYIVVEDQVMFRQGNTLDLDPDADQVMGFEADGSTYRFSVEQADGHPGNSNPTIAIEGCTNGADFTVGFLTQFEEDDRDRFVSIDCQENIDADAVGSYFKRGYPKGYGDSLYIEQETDLKYIINFQNSGLDTAIRVVIRDTLSPHLDPSSVRPGASSHDYSFEVYGEGILKFTFEDINLPGSSTNAEASKGFVKYRVSQKPDNPLGTRIKNSAAIYLGFDEPVDTDPTCHLVDEEFVIVHTDEIFLPEVSEVKVYPNPFMEQVTFEIVSKTNLRKLRFTIYDLHGRLVRELQPEAMQFDVEKLNLASGVYVFKIESEGALVSTGRLIVQ